MGDDEAVCLHSKHGKQSEHTLSMYCTPVTDLSDLYVILVNAHRSSKRTLSPSIQGKHNKQVVQILILCDLQNWDFISDLLNDKATVYFTYAQK